MHRHISVIRYKVLYAWGHIWLGHCSRAATVPMYASKSSSFVAAKVSSMLLNWLQGLNVVSPAAPVTLICFFLVLYLYFLNYINQWSDNKSSKGASFDCVKDFLKHAKRDLLLASYHLNQFTSFVQTLAIYRSFNRFIKSLSILSLSRFFDSVFFSSVAILFIFQPLFQLSLYHFISASILQLV